MALQPGQKAPDFKLPDLNKNMVSLSDFKGKKVVLFFFPAAWTGACTKEMCAVQEDFGTYDKMGAVTIGISTDTIFTLKRFKEDYKLDNVTLLSDFNKDAIKAYDVVLNGFAGLFNGVANRATFVIDKDGNISFVHVTAAPGDHPDMDAIKKAVEALN
jgi:peroxiredoxin